MMVLQDEAHKRLCGQHRQLRRARAGQAVRYWLGPSGGLLVSTRGPSPVAALLAAFGEPTAGAPPLPPSASPTEPQAMAPLEEPEQPTHTPPRQSGRGTPPRKSSPKVSPSQPQYHTPSAGGGQPQKPGLLRRWGFIFRAPEPKPK